MVSVKLTLGVIKDTMKNFEARYSSTLSLQLELHPETLRPKDPLLETLAPESGQ